MCQYPTPESPQSLVLSSIHPSPHIHHAQAMEREVQGWVSVYTRRVRSTDAGLARAHQSDMRPA